MGLKDVLALGGRVGNALAVVLALLFLVVLGAGPSLAQSEAETIAAQASGCKMVAKDRYRDPGLTLSWTGACVDGFLEGHGSADIVNASGVIQNRLIGYFRRGVYLGESDHDDEIQAFSGDHFLIKLGDTQSGAAVWQKITLQHSDHAVRVCSNGLNKLIVVLPGLANPADEDGQRALSQEVGELLFARCGGYYQASLEIVPDSYQVTLHNDWRGLEINPLWAEVIVAFPRGQDTAEVTQFKNFAQQSAAEQQQAEANAAYAQEAEERRLASAAFFRDFTQRNDVKFWSGVEHVQQNPYRYEGQIVAVPFQLDVMVDATTAAGRGFNWSWDFIYVTNLPPGFFNERTWAVAAGVVKAPEERTVRGSEYTLSVLEARDLYLCEDEHCSKMFEWMWLQESSFNWGGPAEDFLSRLP